MNVRHVAQISFLLDPLRRTPQQILSDWWPLVDAAEMVAQTGTKVTVIQACASEAAVRHNAVDYHFVAPERGRSTIAMNANFAQLIHDLRPDVFHVHGLGFPQDVLTLSRLAPDVPIFLQDHASRVPRPWRRPAFRKGLAVASGISFCALEQAQPFAAAHLIHSQTAVMAIPECSSRFRPGDLAEARRLTGLDGEPAVLWVGHLDQNKDPLAVLAGVATAMQSLPGLRLWCCFGRAPLMREVRRRLDSDSQLAQRVHLLGKVPHTRIEQLMRAADLFVLGSHREGSGCSLIEALACGLPPVVTDIPSFRALTAGGRIGALWPCGDSHKLSECLVGIAPHARRLRASVQAHFAAEVSFEAVGRKLVGVYRDLLPRPATASGG